MTDNLPNLKVNYPITVKEMVKELRLLIDLYRINRDQPDKEFNIVLDVRKIRFLKRIEPVFYKQAQKYLGAKRNRLLNEILALPKIKNQL